MKPIEEAKATHAELMAWAEEYRAETGRWPPRRFRAEGTRAGNSKLVNMRKAQQLVSQFGGKVVEVIPRRAGLK